MLTGRSVSASSFSHSALVCSSWLELLLARSLPFRVRGSWRSPFERERERENVRADCLAPQLLPLRPIYLSIEQTDRQTLARFSCRLSPAAAQLGPGWACSSSGLLDFDRSSSFASFPPFQPLPLLLLLLAHLLRRLRSQFLPFPSFSFEISSVKPRK